VGLLAGGVAPLTEVVHPLSLGRQRIFVVVLEYFGEDNLWVGTSRPASVEPNVLTVTEHIEVFGYIDSNGRSHLVMDVGVVVEHLTQLKRPVTVDCSGEEGNQLMAIKPNPSTIAVGYVVLNLSVFADGSGDRGVSEMHRGPRLDVELGEPIAGRWLGYIEVIRDIRLGVPLVVVEAAQPLAVLVRLNVFSGVVTVAVRLALAALVLVCHGCLSTTDSGHAVGLPIEMGSPFGI